MKQAGEIGKTAGSRSKRAMSRLVQVALFLLAAIHVASSQGAKGGITGSLLDPTGAYVSGAAVTATNLDTGLTRATVSRSDGVFLFSLLDPGRYRVEMLAPGFKKLVRQPVVVVVTETASLGSVTLPIGDVTETLTITGEAELLQTDSATTGNVFDSKLVANLPLVTRNFTQLLSLQAGVVSDVPVAASFGNGTQGFSVAGARYYDNSIMLNGANAVSAVTGGAYSIAVPSPDTVEEFKVQSSLYAAEYGQSGGSSVNLVTKSGTNTFHGNVYEFFRNDALNANEYFYKASQIEAGNGNKAPVLRQNQFGGTIGGPIRKNRTSSSSAIRGHGRSMARRRASCTRCRPTRCSRKGIAAMRRSSERLSGRSTAGESVFPLACAASISTAYAPTARISIRWPSRCSRPSCPMASTSFHRFL